jgi:hypothetical protein
MKAFDVEVELPLVTVVVPEEAAKIRRRGVLGHDFTAAPWLYRAWEQPGYSYDNTHTTITQTRVIQALRHQQLDLPYTLRQKRIKGSKIQESKAKNRFLEPDIHTMSISLHELSAAGRL